MDIAEAHGRERCEGVVHASHHSVIVALNSILAFDLNTSNSFLSAGFSIVVSDKIDVFRRYEFFQVAHYVPEEPQKIASSKNGNDELGDSKGVDDGNLVVYTRVVFKVVYAFLCTFILHIFNFLL